MAALEKEIQIAIGEVTLAGNLSIPPGSQGVVLFAHGSGSGRHSPRNRFVAQVLNASGLATLLIDLLTQQEEIIDSTTRHLRFNIDFLAERLLGAASWLEKDALTRSLTIGYFGASTGAGAALLAAAKRPETVKAVVSRGGRPDLAGAALQHVRTPTLLIVGEEDWRVVELNQKAFQILKGTKELKIVPGATHLFEEPGALDQVAQWAAAWFSRFFVPG
jgi:dienelactone hydrolase